MKKKNHTIQDGDYGVPEVTAKMWELINRDAKNKIVKDIAKSLEAEDKLQTIKNVFNYVADNFDYKSDPPNVEWFTAPKYFLNGEYSKHLDCDDMVGIIAVLLTVLKIPVRFKAIAWRLPQFTHIIAEAKCCGKWWELDAVQGRAGFNNSIPKSKRVNEQIYENPMRKFVTMEDNFNDGFNDGCCRGRNGYGRPQGSAGNQNQNTNVINVDTGANGYGKVPGGRNSVPYPVQVEKKVPVPYPVTREVVKKVTVPYPVEKKEYIKVPVPKEVIKIKKVRVPVRAISTEPVQFYREFL